MTTTGLVMMIVSNALVILLTVYCFYRVFNTPDVEKHEHALLDIDTHDTNDMPKR